MNFEQILRALLSRVYKVTDGELDELFKNDQTDDGLIATLIARDQSRISELIKPKPGQTFQDGYKKAKGEVMAAFESELKTQYGIESEATGADLMAEIVEANKVAGGAGNEEEIKKSSTYQAMERNFRKQMADLKTEWETKYNGREAELAKEASFSRIANFADKTLGDMKAIIPANAKIASNIRSLFLNDLKGYDYTIEGDDIENAVLSKDGKVVQDAHGYSLKLSDLVKNRAGDFYEFQNNNGGSNGGNSGSGNGGNGSGNSGGGTGYPQGVSKPKSFEEYSNLVSDKTRPLAERKQIRDAWEAEKGTPAE